MPRDPKKEPLVPIDHSAIMDGFNQLKAYRNYLPFDGVCGVCGQSMHVTPAAQKYLCETKKIPVKHLTGSAVYCDACRSRRARIKQLRKGDHWRTVDGGLEELKLLIADEKAAKDAARTVDRFPANWPYKLRA